jgi:peptidoglycan glycosyltransferase
VKFTREINRLLIGVLIAFGVVGISAAYWAIVGPDTILKRDDNPRLVEAEASIVRGDIMDRNGNLLVTSMQEDDGSIARDYLYPAANSALGYFSLRYGVGGAEAAYDPILRGDDLDDSLDTYVHQDLLHQPQVGSAIRLTLDINVQQKIVEAMGELTGAVVVMTVPDGEILALVSLPTYDPNMLDAEWQSLTTAPGNPFFNRVLQGNYQPGGLLETPLLAAALLAREPVDVPIDDADASITLEDVTTACTLTPPSSTLTLLQAYTYSCPAPFVQLADNLGQNTVESALASFGLYTPPTLEGFIVEQVDDSPTPEATESAIVEADLTEQALGQGALTVTPLNVAVITAAIVNGGNAPQPYVLSAIQRPDAADWTPVETLRPSIPITTANTANQIKALMAEFVQLGGVWHDTSDSLTAGGHVAVAYSGDGTQVWFTGFVALDETTGITTAVVIENSDDPALAAGIGETALIAGAEALR